MEDWSELSKERARAHPTREAILESLDGTELGIRELHAQLPGQLSLSQVSYHLGVLSSAELLAGPRAGRYRLR